MTPSQLLEPACLGNRRIATGPAWGACKVEAAGSLFSAINLQR